MHLRPEWNRTCGECKQWWYQDDDNAPAGRRGLPLLVPGTGERMPRPVHGPTPCYKCVKIPESTRQAEESFGRRVTASSAIEPEPWHRAVVQLVFESHCVGHFRDEPWLRVWTAIVRPILLRAEQQPLRDLVGLLTVQAAIKGR